MTSDYGAESQLEKIDMLDYAELVVLNKFDRQGSQDALRAVRKQWRRNRLAFDLSNEDTPVYPTIARQFNYPGLTWKFASLCRMQRSPEVDSDKMDFSSQLVGFARAHIATTLIPATT